MKLVVRKNQKEVSIVFKLAIAFLLLPIFLFLNVVKATDTASINSIKVQNEAELFTVLEHSNDVELACDIELTAQIVLNKSVAIKGNGFELRQTGQNQRVFYIAPGALVRIENMKISGGNVANYGSEGLDGFGGALINFGNLTLQGVVIEGNEAYEGGAIYNRSEATLSISECDIRNNSTKSGYGGGISNEGVLSLNGSIIRENSAPSGGGIYNWKSDKTVTIVGCTISGNQANGADGGGGGITNNGNMTINSSKVSLNGTLGLYGGGIFNNGNINLYDTLISGNQSRKYGGGLLNESGGNISARQVAIVENIAEWGGGVYNGYDGAVDFVNATIAKNSAKMGGGASNAGSMRMTFVTVAGNETNSFGSGIYNQSDSITLINTIVAHNNRPGMRDDIFKSGGNISGNNNIVGGLRVNGEGNIEYIYKDALFEMQGNELILTNNGGSTPSIALTDRSIAIGNGVAIEGIAEDQRGMARKDKPSIGAIESEQVGVSNAYTKIDINTKKSGITYFGQQVSFAAKVNTAGGLARGIILFYVDERVTAVSLISGSGYTVCDMKDLNVGVHRIKAVYYPMGDFISSVSEPTVHIVEKGIAKINLMAQDNGSNVEVAADVSALYAGSRKPSGNISFKAADQIVTKKLSDKGTVSAKLENLPIGANQVTVSYHGDDIFNDVSSVFVCDKQSGGVTVALVEGIADDEVLVQDDENVDKRSTVTTISVTGGLNVGEEIMLEALVSPKNQSGGIPGGRVNFSQNGVTLASQQLDEQGRASIITTIWSGGNYIISTEYLGDDNFDASRDSMSCEIQVAARGDAKSNVDVYANSDSTTEGSAVAFVAQVQGNSDRPPTGFVQFQVNGSPVGKAEPINAYGRASVMLQNLQVGSNKVTALYYGDAYYTRSTSGVLAHQILAMAESDVRIEVNPNKSQVTYGEQITFTVRVNSQSGVPSGSVIFYDGENILTDERRLVDGAAEYTRSDFDVGTYEIRAQYVSDSEQFKSANSRPIEITIQNMDTTIGLSGAETSKYGEGAVFTATVTKSGGIRPLSGDVQFKAGDKVVGQQQLNSDGRASIMLDSLDAGEHGIVAVYMGSENYSKAQSNIHTHTVEKGSVMIDVIGSGVTKVGQMVALKAELTPILPAEFPAGGLVEFKVGERIEQAQVQGGAAIAEFPGLPAGQYEVMVKYLGDSNYGEAVLPSLYHTVELFQTSISVTGVGASHIGEGAVFIANVTSEWGETPTGSVKFTVGNWEAIIGLTDGSATLEMGVLHPNNYPVVAEYLGSDKFAVSAVNAGVHVAGKGDTNTKILGNEISYAGSNIEFSIVVEPAYETSYVPAGSVDIIVGGAKIATKELLKGKTSITLNTLIQGEHTITAQYHGDANFNGSQAEPLTHRVLRVGTSVVLTSDNTKTAGENVHLTADIQTTNEVKAVGLVEYFIGNTIIGSSYVGENGMAEFDISVLPVGEHRIFARFIENEGFEGSISSEVTQIVKKGDAVVNFTCSETSFMGDDIWMKASVAPAVSSAGVPHGTILFMSGDVEIARGELSEGTVEVYINGMSEGRRDMYAKYWGDERFNPSESEKMQHFRTKVGTAIGITSERNTTTVGEPVVVNVQVSAPNKVPIGQVVLKEGTNILGYAPLDSEGRGWFSTISLSCAPHNIIAEYYGDDIFGYSQAQIAHTVVKRDANVTIWGNHIVNDDSAASFGISVSAPYEVTTPPWGSVVVFDNDKQVATLELSPAGTAEYSTMLQEGAHNIKVGYLGSELYNEAISDYWMCAAIPREGSERNPYQIWSAEGLVNIRNLPDFDRSYFVLRRDIDMQNQPFEPICGAMVQFNGNFDGANHTIYNLAINKPDDYYVGLFGVLGIEGIVNNLNLERAFVVGHDFVGGIAGESNGSVSGCNVISSAVMGVSPQQVGGVVGKDALGNSRQYLAAISSSAISLARGEKATIEVTFQGDKSLAGREADLYIGGTLISTAVVSQNNSVTYEVNKFKIGFNKITVKMTDTAHINLASNSVIINSYATIGAGGGGGGTIIMRGAGSMVGALLENIL